MWPLARFSAFNHRCTSNLLAQKAKIHFVAKLVAHHRAHVAAPQLVVHLSERPRIFESKPKVAGLNSWLVLPFHPKLDGLARVLRGLDVHWSFAAFGFS